MSFIILQYDVSKWDDIPVPSNWECLDTGNLYTLILSIPLREKGADSHHEIQLKQDEFVLNPPYCRRITSPDVMSYRSKFLNILTARDLFIDFAGVESCFYLWLNGKFVGYSQDSKLNASFDITDYIQTGQNHLAVQVMRFGAGTYLEDQDYWHLSGYLQGCSDLCKTANANS